MFLLRGEQFLGSRKLLETSIIVLELAGIECVLEGIGQAYFIDRSCVIPQRFEDHTKILLRIKIKPSSGKKEASKAINYCFLISWVQFNKLKRAVPMSEEENLEMLKSHLSLIKSMTGDKAEQEFYQLMEKAKASFGELGLLMGQFYFEYAKFLLQKMEKNIDIFNAGSLPVGQEGGHEQPILEDAYEDDSSIQDNSEQPKSENNQRAINKQSADDANQPEITENQNINTQNREAKQPSQNEEKQLKLIQNEAAAENEGEVDDFEICAENLLCAIKIFETERDRLKGGEQEGKFSLSQVSRWISRCKSRLGDLYQLSQNYSEAISTYREVIHDQEQKQGHESNRGVAEIHYMIANSYLYDNKQGCEKIAIQQFIKSVRILLNHLNLISFDFSTLYEIPTEEKVKVDRFAYLPKSTDSEEVKQIKEVISCLLDKIEDTHEQIAIRSQYEAQKRKTKQEEEQSKFKEVNPNTPVVKLGTFGNRKKKPEELPNEELRKKTD